MSPPSSCLSIFSFPFHTIASTNVSAIISISKRGHCCIIITASERSSNNNKHKTHPTATTKRVCLESHLISISLHLSSHPFKISKNGSKSTTRPARTAPFKAAAFVQTVLFADEAIRIIHKIQHSVDGSFGHEERFDLQMLVAEAKHLLQRFGEAEMEHNRARDLAGSDESKIVTALRMKIGPFNSLSVDTKRPFRLEEKHSDCWNDDDV